MRHFLTLLLFILFSAPSAAISVNHLPLDRDPVVDQARILSASQTETLNQKIRAWYKAGIMQAGVVIVDNSDGEDDFSAAMRIFERWQLGDKGRDNGLLLFINLGERKLRIITGYGLEGALPDISAKAVIRDDITPPFKQGQYFQGIDDGLTAIAHRLQADPETQAAMIEADRKAQAEEAAAERIPVFIFGSFFLSMLMNQLVNASAFLRRQKRKVAGFLGTGSAAAGYFGFGLPMIACLMGGIFIFAAIAFGVRMGQTTTVFPRGSSPFSDGGFGGGGYHGGGGSSGGGGAGGSW